MRRILWLSGFVLGVIGLAAGIGNDLVISAPSSAAGTQQVEGNGVTVIATLLTEQPESTAIKLTLGPTSSTSCATIRGVGHTARRHREDLLGDVGGADWQ